VPLIPPPRAHQLRYHGILAPCASRRDRVVPACSAAFAVAAIEDPAVARKILECLNLPARSPPVQPASWAAIPAEPVAPVLDADWEFDQSRPSRENSDLS
jgi:hypothetical protein